MLFCPKCTENLHITDRQGIEIDFCPTCRGVWLDGGELEKIIERTIQMEKQYAMHAAAAHSERSFDDEPSYRDDRGKYDKKYKKKKKPKHILEDIFDIFD